MVLPASSSIRKMRGKNHVFSTTETAKTAIFNNKGTNSYPADRKKNTSLHLKNKIKLGITVTQQKNCLISPQGKKKITIA